MCGVAMFVWDERLATAVVVALIALPLPLLVLSFQRARRVARLQEQLPPALEILARSIRAGQSLDQAIKLLGQHSPEPLAKEFRWCAQQLEMGLSLPAVMRSLSQRVQIYDMRILATTLVVHRQTGGNIVNVLERLAQVIRERLNYRRQLRATTAAGRMSAGFVALVAPGVFLYFFFFRTEYLRAMLQSSLGVSLLVIAVILEIVGLIWTARLTRPAY
jgi:tight adherence protein B